MSDITLLSADAFDLQGRNWAENELHSLTLAYGIRAASHWFAAAATGL